jgi:hypothetical protein
VINPDAKYAFVIDWQQRYAPKALAALWQKGYKVRAAIEPFNDGNTTYTPGSIIVLLGANEDKIGRIAGDMQDIARKCSVKIEGKHTGRMASGWDLADSRNRPVRQPRIALLVDPPFDMYSTGQIYHLFDWETELPIERIRVSTLKQTALPKFDFRYGGTDLRNYDVLILAGGGRFLSQVFYEESLRQIRSWVEGGGTLIATETAAAFFTEQRSRFSKVKLVEPRRDSTETASLLKFSDREDFNGKQNINGAVFNAQMDVTHPLAFGLKPELYSLKTNTQAFEPGLDFQAVGTYSKNAKNVWVAGYASQKHRNLFAGKVFAGVMPFDNGRLILLADNPVFRAFWRGPSRMMQNAVMLMPGLK